MAMQHGAHKMLIQGTLVGLTIFQLLLVASFVPLEPSRKVFKGRFWAGLCLTTLQAVGLTAKVLREIKLGIDKSMRLCYENIPEPGPLCMQPADRLGAPRTDTSLAVLACYQDFNPASLPLAVQPFRHQPHHAAL